jgi:hypothetical protein
MKIPFQKSLFILFLLVLGIAGDIVAQQLVIDNFNNISGISKSIRFESDLEINNKGGHLQGIQYLKAKGKEYALISGSSGTYSYYSVVKLGSKNEVILVNKLMDKPFKHSGGFQIFENYMAIGIEDNSKKDKSKVCIYDITNPGNITVKPISIIEREGKPMRSTAGCVGIAKYKNKALVVVGDWDTKHLDFYNTDFDTLGKSEFEKVATIKTQKTSRKGWVDKKWESYQNINLFVFNDNELYLIGLGQNGKDENIADLFRLEEDNSGNFSLIKLASKTFQCNNESSFKAGAGVYLNEKGKFQIYSCSYHINHISYLNYFDNIK